MNKNRNAFLGELLFVNSLYGQYYGRTARAYICIYVLCALLGHTAAMGAKERS